MSALGQKRTPPSLNATQLFDHFVRDREQARRNAQRQCLRGLQVEHELELCGLNHWHIARLFTFQNPSRVDAGPADKNQRDSFRNSSSRLPPRMSVARKLRESDDVPQATQSGRAW